jgi:UDP-glucose-4-epimerase GalE
MPDTIPITEDHPQKPINPYGRSKLMIEQILKDYDTAYGMKHIILRYFNAAGADPEGELGEVHDPETHLIPLAISAAMGLRPHLEIFGNDYPTVDGTAVRDYVHVSDLATAHVKALGLLLEENKSWCFNLGTGTGYSVLEVLDAIEKTTGATVPVVRGPRRLGDPHSLMAAAGKVKSAIGWAPETSDIEMIVHSAWQWQKKNAG